MSENGLAGFYRRYNACCNEHRFDDLSEFVAADVTVNGTDHGLSVYVEGLRAVVRAFPDYRWELRPRCGSPPTTWTCFSNSAEARRTCEPCN